MRILFVDDSGNRRGNPREPYFCMGGFSIDSAHVKQLARRLSVVKSRWGLRPIPDDEIKFSHIGRDHDTPKKPNPLVRKGYGRPQRQSYGQMMLTYLAAVPTVKVFAIGVDRRQLNSDDHAINWAFMLLSERFEFSLNKETPRVGMIICDTEDVQDEAMRQALYSGSIWTKLPNIAETVVFVPSHHSPGVQFADFVIGAAARWWNYRDPKYLATLAPVLGRTPSGEWRGCGLKSFRHPDYPDLG